MNIQIRKALDSDRQAISDVVLAAFGVAQGPEIVELIAALSADPSARPSLALVAAAGEAVIGHILFTKAGIKQAERNVSAALLAPLSVHPTWQNRGVGGRLVQEGLERMGAGGIDLVFVLGHPGYYPRFGFRAAGAEGFDAPYPIPPEHAGAWMVQELHPGMIGRVAGQVTCAQALDDPRHWRE